MGTDLSGGRVLGRKKGGRGGLLHHSQRGQTAQTAAVYSHITAMFLLQK